MKKTTLIKTMLLLCALIVGSSNVWAKQYKKVTSSSELVNGAKYLIISEEVSSKVYALSTVSGNYRAQTEVTISNDIVDVIPATSADDTTPFEIMLIQSGDNWNIYDNVNKNYLDGGATKSSGNNNYLKTAALETKTGKTTYNGVWSISVNNSTGEATITNQNGFKIQYNSSNSWFGSYSANQKKVYLYKEIAEPTQPSTSITWDFSYPFTGTVTASTTNTLYATDGSTEIIYVAGSSDQINSSGYLKPNGASTKSGGNLTSRYLILHIANSGTLTLTSNSSKPGEYLIYQGESDDITAATAQTSIITSSTDLTASEDYDIANGEYLFIGFKTQIYTEKVVWAVPNEVTLTTSANMNGWRAFYDATQDYTLDANTKAYVAQAKSGTSGVVELTQLNATAIPHGEAVILKTSAGDHKMVLTKTTGAATLGTNLLAVTNGSSNVDGYRLGYGNIGGSNAVGFFKYTTTTAPAAGIVYIDKGNVNNGAGARGLAISFGDDATAIEAVKAQNVVKGEYFNLAGQRVAQPTKGLYIVNGRKVVMK